MNHSMVVCAQNGNFIREKTSRSVHHENSHQELKSIAPVEGLDAPIRSELEWLPVGWVPPHTVLRLASHTGLRGRGVAQIRTRHIVALPLQPPVTDPKPRRLAISPVSYTHLRAHETPEHLVCRLLLEKKKNIYN
eukprot:TRINITY_DN43515_c0_g1_i1.p1 TRINITY_DN43515_c0_g1~~TRINITY_DN43515_c0_g1_i1.p1  ORF type:complete len:135 (+),score=10.40 TRINITY_DN43515_c0_g1_i1:357-761(+)